MAVQWFPGHMNKARRIIKQTMSDVDLVIEVMDARIPYSSENPLVDQLRRDRPCIKLLNKSDLADPAVTARWITHFEKERGVKAMEISVLDKKQVRAIPGLCRKMLPERGTAVKDIRVMIMGIPNVGKSTLINSLAGKTIAKVGDEPAVTKDVSSAQQRIKLEGNISLADTPGILWPKIENPASGYRLAVSGAIKNTAIDFEDIALFAADYLRQAYPERLQQRYKLEQPGDTDIAVLENVGRKRGCLRAGGVIDLQRASEILVHDIRSGALGRLSMETPQMVEREVEALKQANDQQVNDELASDEPTGDE